MPLQGESYIYEPRTSDPTADGEERYLQSFGQFRRKIGDDVKISANFDDIFHHFDAAQLISPNSSDWAVNALAPMSADSNNVSLAVRLFDDTDEEGVGFQTRIPLGVAKLILEVKSRAETAPGAARTVGLKLYNRSIPDNGAVGSWSGGVELNDIDIPANEYFQYDLQEIALSALGITAGDETQFELTRINPSAGTELTGDWALLCVQLRFG